MMVLRLSVYPQGAADLLCTWLLPLLCCAGLFAMHPHGAAILLRICSMLIVCCAATTLCTLLVLLLCTARVSAAVPQFYAR